MIKFPRSVTAILPPRFRSHMIVKFELSPNYGLESSWASSCMWTKFLGGFCLQFKNASIAKFATGIPLASPTTVNALSNSPCLTKIGKDPHVVPLCLCQITEKIVILNALTATKPSVPPSYEAPQDFELKLSLNIRGRLAVRCCHKYCAATAIFACQ